MNYLCLFIESSNSSNFEQSPIKIILPSVEENDNTDDDIKSDIKSNKNESSLEDIETDENVSFGNDSLPSTDSFVSLINFSIFNLNIIFI